MKDLSDVLPAAAPAIRNGPEPGTAMTTQRSFGADALAAAAPGDAYAVRIFSAGVGPVQGPFTVPAIAPTP
jgi:hypothetical protein